MHGLLFAVCCLISGSVHAPSGTPIADAHIALRGHAPSGSATSDSAGKFSLQAPAGDYQMDVSARGFGSVTIDLKLERDAALDVALQPLDAPTLRTIGTVTVDGRLAPARGTIPSVTLSRADFERLGENRVVQGLLAVPSVTFAHPNGGQAGTITTVALRGPDPSETLITLDGQLLNDANTGDVDLSQFPVSTFSSVHVTEGLGPRDSEGSNTIGGAVNLVSLNPTQTPHYEFTESVGSFGLSNLGLNATGTTGRLGYGLAADNLNQAGYVNESQTLFGQTAPTHLGSTIAAHAALANATWSFTQNADLTARVFLLGDVRDMSSAINGLEGNPPANAGDPPLGSFIGPGNQSLSQNIRAYQLRGRLPFGSGTLVASASASNNSVTIDGQVNNPMYDVTHRDKRNNESLSWQRAFGSSDFALGGYTQYETFDFVDPVGNQPSLSQTIGDLYARGSWQASNELQLSGGLYWSHYSTFGSSTDWRLGAIYNTSPSTAFRASAGTGFRAPLLIERYVFPVDQLELDANGVYNGQGNPNEQPEHATEYELGYSQRFSSDATLDLSLYRTNLRDPIENFYPLQAAAAGTCLPNLSPTPPMPPNPQCFSYPINVGNVVYEGAEVHFAQRFPREHLFLNAMYGLNVAYPFNFGSTISNPTSGGNLVNNEQFLGIPQQQGSLQLDWAQGAWHASGLAVFRGNNNELNQGPFTWIDAAVGTKLNDLLDITLVGTNLFNAGSGRYTVYGGGVPYRGVVGPGVNDYGPIPTDKLVTDPFGFKFVLTVKT